ncbi:MAG TPA: hypothetical protein VF267_01530 [Gammaproteobacteria bacterium]
MLNIAIGLFLLAAVGGIVMAAQIFKGDKPAVAIAALHGPLAAIALLLVFWTWMQSGASQAMTVGLGILVVAALGGFFLLSFHVRNKPHPKPVVVLHALLAVSGVVALLIAAL